MRPRPLTAGLAAVITIALAWTQRAETQAVPGLFVDAAPLNALAAPQSPATVRSRSVTIDFDRLRETLPPELGGSAQRQTLALTLFPDVSATAELGSVELTATGYVWIGRLSNGREGQVTLAVTGNVMAGSISTGDTSFSIRHAANGVHVIEEVDQAALPPELPPLLPPQGAPRGPHQPLDPIPTLEDDGSIIDVLVVYTPSARTAQGGTSAMQAKIDLGITETNLAYADSGATQRLRLVWKEEVAYTEAASMSTDLSRLANTADGIMDNVHTLRNTYGADLVQLIVNNSSACGVAYLMTTQSASFASSAFGVTHHSCISPNYSFAHEMAHNMGVHHDVYVTGGGTGVYAYSHGYVNQAAFPAGAATNKRWRDIMAYNNQCADSGFNCTRLRYFSNPANTYTGDPMGDAGANAAASLDNTRVTVSNFRQSIPAPPAAFVKSLPASGSTVQSLSPSVSWGASSGATGYEVCSDTTNDNACTSWTNVGVATSTFLSGLSPATTYYWHVRAVNAGGTTYSNGGATAFWNFTTGSAPGAFNKTAPAQNATLVSTTPSLVWAASSGATGYEYCIDTSNNNACNTSWVSAGANVSVTLPPLPASTTHYWHVRASNGVGTTYSQGNATSFMAFTTEAVPIGQVDTPAQNAAGVQGAIAVTGWTLDDIGVTKVEIFRNCLGFESANCQTVLGASLVYIGDAAFLTGARPDVAAAFPTYPNKDRAGWGYLMLTPLLPHVPNSQPYGGQGALTIYAVATDANGNKKLLGRSSDPANPGYSTPTAIGMTNDTIAKPFGAIDTPGQGQTIGGIVNNFGWAITPDTNTIAGDGGDILIPANGSTMTVFIDGNPTALVAYNQCRGNVGNPPPGGVYCNDDVANIFGNTTPQAPLTTRTSNPTKFRNLDAARAAIGAYTIDTASLSNGPHTIAWSVSDSLGRNEGIGSRFFMVSNGASRPASDTALQPVEKEKPGRASSLEHYTRVTRSVWGRTGFDLAAAWRTMHAKDNGTFAVRLPEAGRLELWLGETVDAGYVMANGRLHPLPVGSSLAGSKFAWMPPAGYSGPYRLVFVRGGERIDVTVTVVEKPRVVEGEAQIRMGPLSAHVLPCSSAQRCLRVEGIAFDPQAAIGSGIAAVHVWATKAGPGVRGAASPVFMGTAMLDQTRPDVVPTFGDASRHAGFSITATLAPGTYLLTAYAWNERTARWEDSRSVQVNVR